MDSRFRGNDDEKNVMKGVHPIALRQRLLSIARW